MIDFLRGFYRANPKLCERTGFVLLILLAFGIGSLHGCHKRSEECKTELNRARIDWEIGKRH